MNFGSSNNCLFPYRVVGVWRSGAKEDSLSLSVLNAGFCRLQTIEDKQSCTQMGVFRQVQPGYLTFIFLVRRYSMR